MVIAEKIVVFNKKKEKIIEQIHEHNLLKINNSYDYLLDMKLYILTEEKIKELEKKLKETVSEIKTFQSKTIEIMWTDELNSLV